MQCDRLFLMRSFLAACFLAVGLASAAELPSNSDFVDGLSGWKAYGAWDQGAFWLPPYEDDNGDPIEASAAIGLFLDGAIWTCINLPAVETFGPVLISVHEAGSLGGRPTLLVDSYVYDSADCTGSSTPYFVHYDGAVEPNYPFSETLIGAQGFDPAQQEGAMSVDLQLLASEVNMYDSYRATAIVDRVVFSGTIRSIFACGFE